jgi:transcriptional regulator with XRE-family HTH domain
MGSEDSWKQWEREMLRSLAVGIRTARRQLSLSQSELAESTGASKGLVMNLEASDGKNPRLQTLPSITILIRIALALRKSPIELLYPHLPNGPIQVWPGMEVASIKAVQWFSGELAAGYSTSTGEPKVFATATDGLLVLSRRYLRILELMREASKELIVAQIRPDDARLTVDLALDLIQRYGVELDKVEQEIRDIGGTLDA